MGLHLRFLVDKKGDGATVKQRAPIHQQGHDDDDQLLRLAQPFECRPHPLTERLVASGTSVAPTFLIVGGDTSLICYESFH